MRIDNQYYNLEYISDLMYYDGPLLTLFEDINKNPVLMMWLGNDSTINHWIVFYPTEESSEGFQMGSIDLKSCMLSSNKFELVDIDTEVNYSNKREIDIFNYPDYLPEEGCYL